jgi:hypothetical protein
LALVSILAVSAEARAQIMMRVHARVIEKAAVRIEPSLTRIPLTTLAPGAVVTVLNVEGDWVNVEFEDDRYGRRFGYMQRRSVSLPSAAAPQSAERSKTQAPAARAGTAASVGASTTAPEASPRASAAGPKPAPATPAAVAAAPVPEAAASTPKPAAAPVLFPEPARPVADRPKVVEAVVFPAPASPKKAATEPKPDAEREKTSSSATSAPLQPLGNASPSEAPSLPAHPEPTAPAIEAAAPPPAPLESPAPAIVARDARVGRDPVTPTKGMPLTLMIPRALLKEDGYTTGSRRLPIVVADVDSPTGKPLSVNGRADWMLAGLPSLVEASVEKVNRTKNYTELDLRGKDLAVKLRFATEVADPEQTLGQLVAEGGRDADAAVRYRKEAHAALARSFFPRDLGDLGDERKLDILGALQSSPGAPDIHVQGNRLFASFDLGTDVNVYNDLDFDQAFIVAHVLNETLLARVRELSKSLPDVPELSGVRVLYRVPHKHQKRAAEEEYRLELFATRDQLASFSASQITGQDFLDASTLTVDGKAARIPLSASRR